MAFQRVISKIPIMSLRRFFSTTPSIRKPLRIDPTKHLNQFPPVQSLASVLRSTRWKWVWFPLPAAIFAIATSFRVYYWSSSKRNPLTKRKQFLPLNGQELVDITSAFAEHYMTNLTIKTQRDANGRALDAETQRVETIMNRLIERNPKLTDMLVPEAKWEMIVIEPNRDFNTAFSYACGKVIVPADIIGLFPQDDELAVMIAHEMSHVILQHGNEQIGRHIFMFQFLLPILSKIAESIPDLNIGRYIRKLTKHIDKPDMFIHEEEADQIGFKFASRACYDYRKFGNLLGTMMEHVKAGNRGAFATNNERFEKDVYKSMAESDLWFEARHPNYKRRVELMRSQEWLEKGKHWRKKGGCIPEIVPGGDPLQAILTLSQKVDELNASRKAKLQNQVNNDKVGQSQVEKQNLEQNQDSQNQIEKKLVEQKQTEQNQDHSTQI